MKKTQIINRRGQVVAVINDDDDAIVPDGFGIRVPMLLQDGVPTGHKPGYIYNATDSEAPARAAYAAMKTRVSDAWRTTSVPSAAVKLGGPSSSVADQTQDATNAREAYKAGLQDSWKTRPVVVEDKAQRQDTRDAAPDSNAAWRAMVRRTENAWRTR